MLIHNRFKAYASLAGALAAISFGFSSCVDHDYDLTEDIDLTIQVGSELLTIPASSTDVITLDQILDLDEGSSIIAVENDGTYGLSAGDYVLLQEGNSAPSHYDVPVVTLNDLKGSTSVSELPTFTNTGTGTITQYAEPIFNGVHLAEDNVTKEIVSISKAELEVGLSFTISYESDDFSGGAIIINEGFEAAFPESWTIELPAGQNFVELVDKTTVRFKEDYSISNNHPLVLSVLLKEVDFSKVDEGQGLYAPGHFRLDDDIASHGNVSLSPGDLAVGESANIRLITKTDIQNAEIRRVTGVVNPQITVNATSFTINDIPDFLSDDENHLDIENPQVYFTVENNSPLTLDVNGMLRSLKDGATIANVGLGAANGTAPITVRPLATTVIVISRRPVGGNHLNVVVPTLGTILETIPDEIVFENVTCKAEQKDVTFSLGETYTYSADYEAVIPLAFGADMRLHYTDTVDDWDSEDLDKYNFNKVELTADAINTLPLDMTPEVYAIDRNGNDIPDVTATIEGVIDAGSIAAPATTPIKITLQSSAANLGKLNGIRLVFDAVSAPEHVGTALNKAQSLRFENIKVQIIGGIIVDLND